ncbi:MAG: M28 family peptidase [Sphingorhabdus sp.]
MRRSAKYFVSLITLIFAAPLAANVVTEDDLRAHIATLASDDFEGRAPGSEGEAKTINYIAESWKAAGLKPAARDGSWYDPVALVSRGPGSAKFVFAVKDRTLRIASDDIILIGKDAVYKGSLPLLFGGYGVKPDGSVVDGVAGKAVLILLDQPQFAPEDMQSPQARRDALIAAGAQAVIMVADSAGEWAGARRQLLSRPIALESREERAALEGAISSEFAVALVTAAGRDWDKLRQQARAKTFVGEALGINADFDVTTDVRRFKSYNVIGKLTGKKKGSGAVLYMGHWDHLGICEPEGAVDRICNGAVDNASGIAVLNEVAERLSKQRHDRDIYFVATTGEESGLLGAYSFTENPALPLDQIVVALNIDTIAIAPRGVKVAIVGRGITNLDAKVDAIARKAGRKVNSSTDANAYFQRQDGWALTQKGVPALMVNGSFADLDLIQKFFGGDYHGPKDELTDMTELGGAAEDAMLHIELGKFFASRRKYKWNKAGE